MLPKLTAILAGKEVFDWAQKIFKIYEGAPAAVKQRLPHWLGLGDTDEQIDIAIFSSVKDDLKPFLDQFLATLEDYELARLIRLVSGVPAVEEKEELVEGKKKTVKVKSINKPAKDFLEYLAKLTRENGPEAARQHCLNGRVLLHNPLMKRWRESCAKFKQMVLDTAGVNNVAELVQKLQQQTVAEAKVAMATWNARLGKTQTTKRSWVRKYIWPW